MSSMRKKFKEFLIRIFSSIPIALLITFSLIVISVYSGKFLPQIEDYICIELPQHISDAICNSHFNAGTDPAKNLPHENNKNKSLSSWAIAYVIFVLAFLIIFSMREYAIGSKIKQREKDLLHAIDRMPPPSVIEVFKDQIALMGQFNEALHEIKKESELKNDNSSEHEMGDEENTIDSYPDDFQDLKIKYVRFCLNSIVAMTKLFHNSPAAIRFAANLMTLRSVQKITESKNQAHISALLKYTDFTDPEQLLKECEKCLYLRNEISVSSDNEDGSVDNVFQIPFMLPIYKSAKRQIPGAPTAYVDAAGIDLILDAKNTFSGSEYSHVSDKVKNALHFYFNKEEGRYVGSVLSIRLSNAADDEAIGVVNIHSEQPGIFSNMEKRLMFVRLISPILSKIYELTDIEIE